MSAERLLPTAPEAEAGVLGCCLLDPVLNIGDTLEQLPNEEAFYDMRNQIVWHHLLKLYQAGGVVDLLTVSARLQDAGQLANIGGLSYLSELMEKTPSAANLAYYLPIVREKYLLRRMLGLVQGIAAKIYTGGLDVQALLDESERDLMTLNAERVIAREVSIRESLGEVQERLDQMVRGVARLNGIPMGVDPYLDKMLLGMEPGQMIVNAARPGLGKTSLGMQIGSNVALDQGLPVAVFSLEMTHQELSSRLLYQRSLADYQRYRTGYPENADFVKLVDTMPKLSGCKLWIDDTSGQTILQVRAKARRMHAKHGLALVIIDYLQLMKGEKDYRERRDEITSISAGIKSLAKELHIPILVMAQLNREVEKGPWRPPQMSDLRECGAIEQDADVVAMLYEPKSKEDDKSADWSKHSRRVNLRIVKQRNGPTGDCHMLFNKSCMRFSPFVEAKKTDEPPQRHYQDDLP